MQPVLAFPAHRVAIRPAATAARASDTAPPPAPRRLGSPASLANRRVLFVAKDRRAVPTPASRSPGSVRVRAAAAPVAAMSTLGATALQFTPLDALWPPRGDRADIERDAQRWAEIDEIKRMVADLNTTVAATAQEWQADRTELANKLAESEGMRKQLQAQIAALEQAAESRARALQQAQSTATVCYVACGGEWSLYLAHQCPTDCSPRTPSQRSYTDPTHLSYTLQWRRRHAAEPSRPKPHQAGQE